MNRKSFLIAARETRSCPQGVRFVGTFFNSKEQLETTLLYIVDSTAASSASLCMWEGDPGDENVKASGSTEKGMSVCEKFLLRRGFEKDQIRKMVKARQVSTSLDILTEGKKGFYDAVILGKRSTTFLEDLVTGNVGNEILSSGIELPIWFCRDIEEDRGNVLLCLDGSGACFRAADHVGYILDGETEHDVTLLHVDKGQGLDPEELFKGALKILEEHGVSRDRISTKVTRSSRVVKTILKETEKGSYAAVVMGWTGRTEKKGLSRWFAGEKSQTVLDEIRGAAIWIVP